jgi:hypothetical protein
MRVMMPSCLPAEFGTMGLTGAWGALMPLRRHPRSLFDPATPRAEQLHWLRLLGVRYQFSITPLTDPSLTSLRSELPYLYRDSETFPRAFWVPNALPANDFEAALAATTQPAFDAKRDVVIEGAPSVSAPGTTTDAGAAQRIVEYQPERVRLETDAPTPGWLVLTDTPYPGWSAQVDGKPAPLYPADAVARAVQVEAGHHEIEMRFQPATLRVGLFISLATITGLLCLLMIAPPRRAASRARATESTVTVA